MARIRTIKPEFWKHEELSKLPEPTHMLAGALLNYADDEGFFNANVGLVKGECCPLREPSVSLPDSLRMLAEIGYLQFGNARDGRRYGRIVTFDDHQRVNRPTPSKIKALAIEWEDSPRAHEQLSESSLPEGKGREGNREGKGTGKPPASSSAQAPKTTEPKTVDLEKHRAERRAARLVEITDQAIAAYNGILGKPVGLLPAVNAKVGKERRRKEVARCLKVASEICLDQYGDKHVTPKFWEDYFAEVDRDPFRSGRQASGGEHANWKPDFEYLTREATMLKVFEKSEAAA